jgi:hypothetical protein
MLKTLIATLFPTGTKMSLGALLDSLQQAPLDVIHDRPLHVILCKDGLDRFRPYANVIHEQFMWADPTYKYPKPKTCPACECQWLVLWEDGDNAGWKDCWPWQDGYRVLLVYDSTDMKVIYDSNV